MPLGGEGPSGPDRAVSAGDDPAVDPRYATVGGASVSFGAAALALWSILVGGSPISPVAIAAVLASTLCGLLLLGLGGLWMPRMLQASALTAMLAVTAAVATSAEGAAASPVFYVAIVLFSAYFSTRAATVLLGSLAIVAFTATALWDGQAAVAARATLLAVTIAATAGFVRVLRDQVFALIEALDRTARGDALTRVLNRLGLDERLEEELERAQRTGLSCAVLMCDLDDFKRLNDRLGHHAGDAALRHVAAVISGRLRRIDVVGRFGGDEFVLVLPDTTRDAARLVVAELQQALQDPVADIGAGIGMSFGVAMCPADGGSPDEVVAAADADLLEAKRRRVRAPAPRTG